jgi:hypothetical protein
MLLACAEVLVGGGIAFANHGAWHQTLTATPSSSSIHTSPHHIADDGGGEPDGCAVTATGIAGGILDVTGVGAPLGLALNGISLVTGLGQAGIDCTANLNANCGLELGTAALEAVGLGALGSLGKAAKTEKALNDAEDLAKTSKGIGKASEDASDARSFAKSAKATQLAENRKAGNAAADKIADRYKGSRREVTLQTSIGARRIDVLTPKGDAIESKVGKTSLTKRVELQIQKDKELLDDKNSPVRSVKWYFVRSPKTGLGGPSGPLQKRLLEAGIAIVRHD